MTGSHEVEGSIPFSSTREIKGLAVIANPIFYRGQGNQREIGNAEFGLRNYNAADGNAECGVRNYNSADGNAECGVRNAE